VLGEERSRSFFNCALLLQLFININRNTVFERKWMEITMFLPWFCNVFAISHWLVLPCLLCADSLISRIFQTFQPIGTFAQRVSVLFRHFPAAFQHPLKLPRGYPITFKHFPAVAHSFLAVPSDYPKPLRAFQNCY
jgi:hypothetical protein